jgi:thymidine phosphorylase
VSGGNGSPSGAPHNGERRTGGILRARRALIDTYQQPVVYMRRDCPVCQAEGFEAQAQVELVAHGHQVPALLHRVDAGWLAHDEAALSDAAWGLLGLAEGDEIRVRHATPLDSLRFLRAKVYGRQLDYPSMRALIEDISQGRLSDLHLAAFVTACAGGRLDAQEVIALTRAMVDVGDRLSWPRGPVMDKHCVGGLPGNRTTLIVVPIVTACGVIMPKTSSRAITSPAGTADTMETLAPVALDVATMRRVVEREGGCIAWGGSARLSPADDMLIRVERPLDLDSEAQLVASVLSKKAAVGSERVLIDIPVGPTAKVRSSAAARSLAASLVEVGEAIGLQVRVIETDGRQPVGRGIGPALEARDVMSVLRRDADAPRDLRERALLLAGTVLEMAGRAAPGHGFALATRTLDSGLALVKFLALCESQGGLREPPRAAHTAVVAAPEAGRIGAIDNRRLARAAKLAGAPRDAAAGAVIHVRLDDTVQAGQPLFTLHANAPGELAYAEAYVAGQGVPIIAIDGPDAPAEPSGPSP